MARGTVAAAAICSAAAGDREAGVGGGDGDVFGHPVLVDQLAGRQADLLRAGWPSGADLVDH